MTTLAILLTAACAVGLLAGMTLMGALSSGAYGKGWHDGHAQAEREAAELTDAQINEALRLAAGPFDDNHPIWSKK